MSDYTKTTNFTAKDSLPTGNAGKLIKGSEHDTEFDNIATAIATKYDSDDLLDEDDMSSDSATKFPSQQSVKAYVDNNTEVACNDSSGAPLFSGATTGHNPHQGAASTWHQHGPTAASATYTWDELDSIPLGADWIEVRIQGQISTLLGTANYPHRMRTYARKNGSAEANLDRCKIYEYYMRANGSGTTESESVITAKIPLAADNSFDLYYTEDDNSEGSCSITFWLVGYGYNNV